MSLIDGEKHQDTARALVRQLVDEHDAKYGVGSLTCSVYDTAWVALVVKPEQDDAQRRWLYPTAFHYIVSTQRNDGGWGTSSSQIDGILNTLSALLALCRHIAAPLQIQEYSIDDLSYRKARAIRYLQIKLCRWDVATTVSTGFEILVPKLLELLVAEGVEFDFPARPILAEIHSRAAAKFDSSMLYGTTRSVLARTLEGRIGEIDFDRISQHRISGSIMASPAATAAYLMYCSSWDEEAEAYLTHVLDLGNSSALGGVPSQYPTTVFEVTHALSILLAAGFHADDLGPSHLENAGDFLEACLMIDAGAAGSAPYVESDADNTAKAITTLCLLGRIPSPQGLIVRFEAREYFKTYTQDRNPSFRTNCLVLKALLDLLPGNDEQAPQIEKAVRFITNYWWTHNGEISDSTNSSDLYATLLMVDALVRLVDLCDTDFSTLLNDVPLKDKVYICLYQALSRVLQDQNNKGYWGRAQKCENTAYAVLILSKLASFTSAPRVKLQLIKAVESGQKYLQTNFCAEDQPDEVWRGKTTTGSAIVSQAYVLSALHIPLAKSAVAKPLESRYSMSLAKIAIQTKYYARQTWFTKIPEWQIQACLVESQLFLPQLHQVRHAVFPESTLQGDQHFETVPFTWLAASNFDRRMIGPEYLFQMMIASFLNRQLDDYVMHYIARTFPGCLFEVEDIIHEIFDGLAKTGITETGEATAVEENVGLAPSNDGATNSAMCDTRDTLQRYISHIIKHPYVLQTSPNDQADLRAAFMAFILAKLRSLHIRSSTPASAMPKLLLASSNSDQTHHLYTFSFLACLVGNQAMTGNSMTKRDFLDTTEQQYLAAAMCQHLSTVGFMSSLVNTQRVGDPQNQVTAIKSRVTNFGTDKTHSRPGSPSSSTSSVLTDGNTSPVSATSSRSSVPSSSGGCDASAKAPFLAHEQALSQSHQLTRLLSHERKCLNVSLQSLDAAGIGHRTANIIGLFVDLSELCELIFKDTKLNSTCTPPTSHPAVFDSPTLPSIAYEHPPPPPIPPILSSKRPVKRGSVAAARAAIEIAPLSLGRASSVRSRGTANEEKRMTIIGKINEEGPEDGTPSLASEQQALTWSSPGARALSSRRTSRCSSFEAHDIEQMIADLGDTVSITTSMSSSSKRQSIHKAKVNPVLRTRPRANTNTEGGVRPARPELAKRIVSAAFTEDLATVKLARARSQSQKRLNGNSQRRLNAERRAKETEEFEAKRRRASALQSRAMVQAQRVMSSREEQQQQPLPDREMTITIRQKKMRDPPPVAPGPQRQPYRSATGPAALERTATTVSSELDKKESSSLKRVKSLVEMTVKLPISARAGFGGAVVPDISEEGSEQKENVALRKGRRFSRGVGSGGTGVSKLKLPF